MAKIDWDALLRFVGHGPNRAVDVLFLGLKERAVEQERNLTARATFQGVEDLRAAHEVTLARAGCHNPFADKHKDPVKQWNTASRFALAISGSTSWNDRAAWSDYWRNSLGRAHGSTFLMECFPFPRATRSTPLPGYPDWTDDEVWDRRRPILRQYLTQNAPKFVIAYGKATKAKASELLAVPPDAWQAVPNLARRVEVATNGETCIAHVGFFGRGYFANGDIPGIVRAMQDRVGAS